MYKDRKVVEQLVRRAEKAGFKAIALTVDTPRLGRREADIRNRWGRQRLVSGGAVDERGGSCECVSCEQVLGFRGRDDGAL